MSNYAWISDWIATTQELLSWQAEADTLVTYTHCIPIQHIMHISAGEMAVYMDSWGTLRCHASIVYNLCCSCFYCSPSLNIKVSLISRFSNTGKQTNQQMKQTIINLQLEVAKKQGYIQTLSSPMQGSRFGSSVLRDIENTAQLFGRARKSPCGRLRQQFRYQGRSMGES